MIEHLFNPLDFDRPTLYMPGLRTFQFQFDNTTFGSVAGDNYMLFDSTGLNLNLVRINGTNAKNPDASLTSESTVTNAVIQNVLRSGQVIVVKNIVMIVNSPGQGWDGVSNYPVTVNEALSNNILFSRALIDGRVLRGADANPNSERRNNMFQEDMIMIPGPIEIDSTFAMTPFLNYEQIVTFIFEVDELR